MEYYKEFIGATPNGGVKSVIYFFDSNGNPSVEDAATNCRIIEFDSSGNAINEINGLCN